MSTLQNGQFAWGPGAELKEDNGNTWAINTAGQLVVNGVVDPTTRGVQAISYYNGQIWQKNDQDRWYSKTNPSDPWYNLPPGSPTPVPLPAPTSGFTVITPNNGTLIDPRGNHWSITGDGKILVDGFVDPYTANVTMMTMVNNQVWQQNKAGYWYTEPTPNDSWTGGVTSAPLSGPYATQEWTGAAGADPTNPANWSQNRPLANGEMLYMAHGTLNLGSGHLDNNPLVMNNASQTAPLPVINVSNGAGLLLESTVGENNAATVTMSTPGAAGVTIIQNGSDIDNWTVAAAQISTIIGTFNTGPGKLTFSGGTWMTNNISELKGTNAYLGATISGSGQVLVSDQGGAEGLVTIDGVVGPNVRFEVAGNTSQNEVAGVVVNHPTEFQGSLSLSDGFAKLANVDFDNVSFANDMLQIYKGSTLQASLHVTGIADPTNAAAPATLSFGRGSDGALWAYNSPSSLLHNLSGDLAPVALHT